MFPKLRGSFWVRTRARASDEPYGLYHVSELILIYTPETTSKAELI